MVSVSGPPLVHSLHNFDSFSFLAIGGTLAFLTAKKSFDVLYYTFFIISFFSYYVQQPCVLGGTRQLSGFADFSVCRFVHFKQMN